VSVLGICYRTRLGIAPCLSGFAREPSDFGEHANRASSELYRTQIQKKTRPSVCGVCLHSSLQPLRRKHNPRGRTFCQHPQPLDLRRLHGQLRLHGTAGVRTTPLMGKMEAERVCRRKLFRPIEPLTQIPHSPQTALSDGRNRERKTSLPPPPKNRHTPSTPVSAPSPTMHPPSLAPPPSRGRS